MSDAFVLQDREQRRYLQEALDENLFVEAGAGTGKTSSLVDRMVALVASGRATLDRVAAITFTEAAAAELRDRVREALERAATDPVRPGAERDRCAQGVADLDRAAVQTLHSFAGSLLRERPLEAGLPPSFETLDQIGAGIAFHEAWDAWVDGALDDPALQPSLRLALSLGLTTGHLRQVATKFHESYDLLEGVSFPEIPVPPPGAVPALIEGAPELERLCALSRNGDGDPLAARVRGVIRLARRLEGLDSEAAGTWRVLSQSLPFRFRLGRVADWDEDPATGQNACTRLKALLQDLDRQTRDDLQTARQACLAPLLQAVAEFVRGYAARRKQEGRAEFHDLLVWARDLLRDNLEVRDHFRERYGHLLVDEAQDTDPIQAEIASFLAEDAPSGAPAASRPRRWTDVPLAPGRLFVVGDPKQSIYRFRRADVSVMAQFQASIAQEPVRLVQNFRSQRAVVTWVNRLFQSWMQGDGQAAYVAIAHRWEPDTGHSRPPSVWYLGGPLDEKHVGPVRKREAEDIASLARRIQAEEWQVLDREATEREGKEQFRAARLQDICILLTQRGNLLRTLEVALENAQVPYRLEGASLAFGTQEVRDLLNCLRAVDDPADQVSLVAALRSPALACSDADLLEFVESGGRLDYLAPYNPATGTVAEAMAVLHYYHHRRLWTSPAALMEEFVRERQLRESALAAPRPRERWRRYTFLMGQARAFAEAGGGSLRAFLKWATEQAEEGARVTEAPMPETDEDAVRVMTVHSAKGLEFPIVILTGLNFPPSSRSESVLFDRDGGGVEVQLGSRESAFQTPGYDGVAQRESEQQEAEDVRLMYVAATRARDHLVVCLHRTANDQKSRAALLAHHLEGADDLWKPVGAGAAPPPTAAAPAGPEPGSEEAPEARRQWLDARGQLLLDRARSSTVAATTLSQTVKEDAGAPEEPWRRGRAGTNLGRAVHAVLQTVDLATGRGLEDTARAQAAAEGLPHREDEIARLARVALKSNTLQRAIASGKWWREVPVAAPVGDTVIEGFIDLLFEEDDGLVLVDYKTDVLETEQEIAQREQHYRVQAGAYALAVQEATGRRVKEVVLLFLEPDTERSTRDVASLLEEARHALSGLTSDGG